MNSRISREIKKLLLLCITLTLVSCTGAVTNEIIDENKLDEDMVSQCISATIEFENLQESETKIEYIDTIVVGQAAYAYLLDEKYNILEHPMQEHIGNNLFDITGDLFADPLSKLVEAESYLFYKYEFDNTERLVFFYKAKDNHILAITGLETSK